MCNNVTDVEARKLVLRNTGRCYLCLSKYHMSRDCWSGNRCPHCQGRHHVSICSRGMLKKTMSKLDTTHTSMTMTTCPDTRTPPSNRDPTHSMYTNANTSILLQTAWAIVYNPNQPHLTTEVRLILDSGSQRSYVTDKVKYIYIYIYIDSTPWKTIKKMALWVIKKILVPNYNWVVVFQLFVTT